MLVSMSEGVALIVDDGRWILDTLDTMLELASSHKWDVISDSGKRGTNCTCGFILDVRGI